MLTRDNKSVNSITKLQLIISVNLGMARHDIRVDKGHYPRSALCINFGYINCYFVRTLLRRYRRGRIR